MLLEFILITFIEITVIVTVLVFMGYIKFYDENNNFKISWDW
jgi:hypothetical protein